jgi:nucleotide sugar dehydrogenase
METVAIVGLGYVGLPVAVAFGRHQHTIGFDLNPHKVELYKRFCDSSGELSSEALRAATYLEVTTDSKRLTDADYVIVAVPTPINAARRPHLIPLRKATTLVGQNMRRGAVVIFESTVYPGVTEELCVPTLETQSGMTWKRDFHVGYSPERINPGDKEHRFENILKVVSGDDEETLERVVKLYGSVVKAGVYRAPSIKVAEAAKVIENTQRDLNIALMNELAMIFHELGIDTAEVLEAAGTKWNFIPFRPGLVGGHCIGVDPYYLTHKAETVGYHPQIILAGRRINDGMGKYVAEQTIKQMIGQGSNIKGAKIAVFGLTFKENCADLRNSRVFDLIVELKSYGTEVVVHDPIANAEEARKEYGIELVDWPDLPRVAALVLAVPHKPFLEMGIAHLCSKLAPGGCLVDVKSVIDRASLERADITVWRL